MISEEITEIAGDDPGRMWRSGEQIYPVDDPFQQRIRIYKGLSGGYAGRSTAGSDPARRMQTGLSGGKCLRRREKALLCRDDPCKGTALYIYFWTEYDFCVFRGSVEKAEGATDPSGKAQKNIHKNVQKKVQQLSAQEVEKCIEACVTGCKVQHRKYGTGEIISGDGRIAEILFLGENTPRKISLPIAFSAQILTLK